MVKNVKKQVIDNKNKNPKKRLIDDPMWAFTEEKYKKWLAKKDQKQLPNNKPQLLISCPKCQKVFTPDEYRPHKAREKKKKDVLLFLKDKDGYYPCKIESCHYDKTQKRKDLILHFMTHSLSQLHKCNLNPKILFRGDLYTQYFNNNGMTIDGQNQTLFEEYKNEILKEQQEVSDILAHEEISNKHLNMLETNSQNKPTKIQKKDLLKLIRQDQFKEIQIMLRDAFEMGCLIDEVSILDSKLFKILTKETSYYQNDLQENAYKLQQIWNHFKYLKICAKFNFRYCDKLLALRVVHDEMILISKGFNSTLQHYISSKPQIEPTKLALLALVDAVKELHSHQIVH